ncbi:MAG TPA: aryl-sulfate sulfotransferase, partial [Dehalococcoidia bacterium]|nr:aryl-sulfate sulfotransferase [Dehalococcoidia bacterium]
VSLFDLLDPAIDRTDASNITGGFVWQGCDGQAPGIDWTHSNSIWVAEDGSYIVSVRHLNQVIAIAPDLQSVLWRLGGPGSDFSFPDPNDQFYFQHSAKLLPNGNLLLFDNGNARPEDEGGQYSRALELELDFDNLVARKAWEYRYTPDLYAGCCSDVQRLENGNSVLVFGSDPAHESCCRVFTLVEAGAQGETVSAIEISSPGKGIQYRAYPLDTINGESRR